MDLLADTSAWSRFYRDDVPPDDPVIAVLEDRMRHGSVVTTGIVMLELLRGFTQARTRNLIEVDLGWLVYVEPSRRDYVDAAELGVTCRRAGVQLQTVDALIAQLCISRDLMLLTTDQDFVHAAEHVPLRVWAA